MPLSENSFSTQKHASFAYDIFDRYHKLVDSLNFSFVASTHFRNRIFNSENFLACAFKVKKHEMRAKQKDWKINEIPKQTLKLEH